MKKQTTLLFSCLIFSITSFSQITDVKKMAAADIKSINDTYKKLDGISMVVNYSLFRDHLATVPKETHKGYYCKDGGENMLLELYGTTTIRTRNYLFVKDDSSDVVMIKKPAAKEIFSPSQVDYGKLLEMCSTIEKLTGAANECGYRMNFKGIKGEIDKLELFFDKNSFLIQKVVIYYNRELSEQGKAPNETEYFKPRLEVKYENIRIGAHADKNIFSISKYLVKNKKGWALQPSYSKYELIDQTIEKVK